MWVEFVVGSRPCSKGFSPGTVSGFFTPQKPTFHSASHSVVVPLKLPFAYFKFHTLLHST